MIFDRCCHGVNRCGERLVQTAAVSSFGGFVIRGDDSRLFDHYIAVWLRASLSRSGHQGTRGSQNINQSRSLGGLALPPLDEQHAIAEALGDVDTLLLGLDQLIEKKRAVKQAVMEQLLTGRRRLPGFSGEWSPFELLAFLYRGYARVVRRLASDVVRRVVQRHILIGSIRSLVDPASRGTSAPRSAATAPVAVRSSSAQDRCGAALPLGVRNGTGIIIGCIKRAPRSYSGLISRLICGQ
ncbi:MAG: hypothetical protein IPN01_26570 [Deltaproteobacteria bacterium]|nr:hypothetical protein [Deltaproteobacteria bacterium]